jgi:hypothetical protein
LKDFSLVYASIAGHLSGRLAYTLVYYDNGLNIPSKSLEIVSAFQAYLFVGAIVAKVLADC